jgi:hypothetical protein
MTSDSKQSFLAANEGGVGPTTGVTGTKRATSDHSRKSLKVTRLSGAERQRRWRKRHREAHKAQQREYMRRKRRDQQEADALDATAQRCREDQELQERVAAANKAIREHKGRRDEAWRLAKDAGLGMEAWLKLPEAENWADMKDNLIAEEREEQELALLEKERGWDRFGNPLESRYKPEPPREPTPSEAWEARRKAAYEAPLNILSNGMILD